MEGLYEDRVEEEPKAIDYKPIRTFYIAGVQHHQMKNALNDIVVGNNLALIRETRPEILKHDTNAVRIEYARFDKQVMLGFVPKKFTPQIAGFIEIGMKLECVVTEFNPTAKPWEQCKVEIREVKE